MYESMYVHVSELNVPIK